MEGLGNYELPPPYRPEKKKRKMVQPTKDYIRAELKLADAEIERLQDEIAWMKKPWWQRLLYSRHPYVPHERSHTEPENKP